MMIPRSRADRYLFVDTGAFVAAADRRDGNHAAASRAFARIEREPRPLFTSNLVVAETYVLMRKRIDARMAIRWLSSLDLNLEYEGESDYDAAGALLARYDDKSFSYTDAVSFVMMERLGIPTAFTFDEHFRQYGVAVLP